MSDTLPPLDAEPHVCQPIKTDENTVTCPDCSAVYVLDPDATADERSYVAAGG